MNLLNLSKFFNAIPPGIIRDDAAYTSNVLDKADWLPTGAKGVLFLVQLGSIDAAAAALKVVQSDTQDDATTLGGTPADVHDVSTKPGADDDDKLWLVYVPMSKWTERYLQLQATAGNGAAGTYLSAVAVADHPGHADLTAASLGAGQLEIA